jgi:hypothetical protein
MLTTYQIKSSELDFKVIDSIKSNFPDEELLIDVYPVTVLNNVISEITNPEIIDRINDIKNNKNILYPNLNI